MQFSEEASHHLSLGKTLQELLRADDEHGISISEVARAVGEKGFGMLLVVLSLPSALPVPAPGYSTPFALQMVCGRRNVWLPHKIGTIRIKPKLADKMIGSASRFLSKMERYIRPRQKWIRGRTGQASIALVVLIMACLMMLPIPLTNTFPAIVIFMIGVGLSEEDGLLAIGAFTLGCCAVLLYMGIVYILLIQGVEAIEPIKDWIKSLVDINE